MKLSLNRNGILFKDDTWYNDTFNPQLDFLKQDFFVFLFSGISLNPEQWNQLKEQMPDIDDAIRRF